MSKLSNLRASLRAAGHLLPRSLVLGLLARLPTSYGGVRDRVRDPNAGEPGIRKYRAWRKKKRKVAQASKRANRNN